MNGIFRLFVVLLEKNEEDELLEYLGWKWDVENNRFTFLRKSKGFGREKIILSRKTLDKLAAVRYTITCAVKISFLNIKIAVL